MVHNIVGIFVSHGHAYDDLLVIRNGQFLPHNSGQLEPCGLRAGVKAVSPGQRHDVAHIETNVQPSTLLHRLMQGEYQPYRSPEKLVITAKIRHRCCPVALLDTKQAIEIPSHLAPPREVRLDELGWVILAEAFGFASVKG